MHQSAMSWQIYCKKGIWYARATWEVECDPIQTSLKSGTMGLDLNATCVEWAVCLKGMVVLGGKKREKKKGSAWCGRIGMNLEKLTQAQSVHQIRHVVLLLVPIAGHKGVPIAVEALDFSRKKASLRYENAKTAKMLSGFAYGKFKQELLRCAAKHSVQVLWVDPAWTSVAGE